VTADDATLPAVEGVAAILHAHGFVVERRAFVAWRPRGRAASCCSP